MMTETSSTSRDAAAARYVDIQHHSNADEISQRLGRWLRDQLDDGAEPEVGSFRTNDANGMSSDTVLFDASWTSQDAQRVEQAFVARIAPSGNEIPVFPRYELTQQFNTMATVGEHSNVLVPRVWWNEEDPTVLGQPFFVMSRVEGQVPPDVLPYTFGENWLFDSSPQDQSRLQRSIVNVLAEIHSIADPTQRFGSLELDADGETHLARHLHSVTDWYRWTLASNPRSALIETALDRLVETLPGDPGETVLSWGDARIGNVLFDDFEPVGVLDWEMAVLGPRELDLAWLAYSHRVFQDLAVSLGAPGMPKFLTTRDVITAYEESSGHQVVHFDWHLLFAATRWAIVFLRTGARQVAISGTGLPEDGNELLHNRPSLEQLLASTYPY